MLEEQHYFNPGSGSKVSDILFEIIKTSEHPSRANVMSSMKQNFEIVETYKLKRGLS